jgi:hypothetical protein
MALITRMNRPASWSGRCAFCAVSIAGGVIGIEALFANALKPGGEHPHGVLAQLVYPFNTRPVAASADWGVCGRLVRRVEALRNAKEDPFTVKFSGLSKLMSNRFYFDEIYEATVIRIHDASRRSPTGLIAGSWKACASASCAAEQI